jgi:hypothetical protein
MVFQDKSGSGHRTGRQEVRQARGGQGAGDQAGLREDYEKFLALIVLGMKEDWKIIKNESNISTLIE